MRRLRVGDRVYYEDDPDDIGVVCPSGGGALIVLWDIGQPREDWLAVIHSDWRRRPETVVADINMVSRRGVIVDMADTGTTGRAVYPRVVRTGHRWGRRRVLRDLALARETWA